MLFQIYSKRNLGLDVLRALAIAMVFIAMACRSTACPFSASWAPASICSSCSRIPDRSYLLPFAAGQQVQAGRVLAGAVVCAPCLRISRRSALCVAMPYYSQEPVAAYYALFTQNFVGMVGFNASWSLCVEEHFYLLFPLVGCAIERLGCRHQLRWLLPLAFLTPLALRLATLVLTGDLPAGWFWMTHLHCEGLIAGVWLAYVKVEQPTMFAQLRRPAMWLTPLIPVLLTILPLWTSRGLAVNVWSLRCSPLAMPPGCA